MTSMQIQTYSIVSDESVFQVAAAVRDTGNDLLLFLHGLGCSKSSWRDVWRRPEFDEFSILCLDFPGYGDSDRPDTFSHSMEDHARVCAEILTGHTSKQVHLIGHSMGGAIGLLLPEDVLISLASFTNVEGNLTPEDCLWASRRTISVSYDQFLSDIWPEFVSDYEEKGKRFHSLDQASPDAFYRSSQSLVAWSDSGNLLQAYQDLTCPTLYVCGDRNTDHPTVAQLHGMDVAAIPNTAHFSMIDNPAAFKLLYRIL